MTRLAYSHAIAGYRAGSQLGVSATDIAIALHQALYSAVSSARYADEQNRLDDMVFQLGLASQILSALKLYMDFSAAGSAGADLKRFYARTHRDVRRMGMRPRCNRDWAIISDPTQNMLRSFINISRTQQTTPVDINK